MNTQISFAKLPFIIQNASTGKSFFDHLGYFPFTPNKMKEPSFLRSSFPCVLFPDFIIFMRHHITRIEN